MLLSGSCRVRLLSLQRPMPHRQMPLKAQRLRAEAERILIDAARFTSEENRRQLLNIAAQYDRLAESLDLHAASRLLQSN